jgi:PadR family transcriptional regulator, regulatory protein PadR
MSICYNERMKTTQKTARLLAAFLETPAAPRYGTELTEITGIRSGSLYPILRQMEEAGWLTSAREDIDPKIALRPARVFYTLTDPAAARDRLDDFTAQFEVLPPGIEARMEADARSGLLFSRERGRGVTAIHWRIGRLGDAVDPNPLAEAIIEHVHGPMPLTLEGRTYQITPA